MVPGFYDLGELQAPDTWLEDWFARNVESPVGQTMAAVRKGVLPTDRLTPSRCQRLPELQVAPFIAWRGPTV